LVSLLAFQLICDTNLVEQIVSKCKKCETKRLNCKVSLISRIFPNPGPCATAKAIDLVILVDASVDMGKKRLETVKKFMAKFISKRPAGRLEPRFSIIQYGHRVRPRAWFGQCIKNKQCVRIAQKNVKYVAEKANLGKALRYALKYAFKIRRRMRKQTRRGILIISSGKSKDLKWVKNQAGQAERLKKPVHLLAVGDKMDKKMIDHIAPKKRQFKIPASKLLKSKEVMKWLDGIYTGCVEEKGRVVLASEHN
jgi:uncharacterized protein YegL